ncbi:MAG: DUF3604 domain-containing protein, partial [Verrucomicrobia bacterium]|nr:DUF3604 domain-containing protein [Verrucomicrobiota bacterium]
MRRPICLIEPSVSYAGEISNWNFIYTTSINLPKGTRIKFDLQSKGRVLDWQVPDTNLKGKGNLIWGLLSNEKIIPAKALTSKESTVPDFEFILPSEIKIGETFTVCMGTPEVKKCHEEGYGTRAQTIVQRRKKFQLYIDPKGKGD